MEKQIFQNDPEKGKDDWWRDIAKLRADKPWFISIWFRENRFPGDKIVGSQCMTENGEVVWFETRPKAMEYAKTYMDLFGRNQLETEPDFRGMEVSKKLTWGFAYRTHVPED